MLVVTALICFVELGWAASIWCKLKTASSMIAICVSIILHILVGFGAGTAETFPVQIISDILMYISCILTTVSGIKYLWDYREVLKTDA